MEQVSTYRANVLFSSLLASPSVDEFEKYLPGRPSSGGKVLGGGHRNQYLPLNSHVLIRLFNTPI